VPKVAIVTGAASGVGRGLAAALVARGDTVMLTDIDAEALASTAKELSNGATNGAEVLSAPLDVRDREAVTSLVDDLVEERGRLDLMFNNAGMLVGGEIVDLTPAHWDRILDVNLRGVMHGVIAAYPHMRRQRDGHIVNTSSLAGLAPAPLSAPYSMTKFGIVGLSLSLRTEAAAHGVRVSVICPGVMRTNLGNNGPKEDLKPSRLKGNMNVNRMGRWYQLMGKLVPPYDPDSLARDTLRGIDRNKPIIVSPGTARVWARLQRISPTLVNNMTARSVARIIATLPDGKSAPSH
jgi:NAD(P)-dependent dehydrogenase (short-subunit alcohol dehydrogenase family)